MRWSIDASMTIPNPIPAAALALLLASCGQPPPADMNRADAGTVPPVVPTPTPTPTAQPTPAPSPTAPVDAKSPEVAVAVVRRYYDLLAARAYPAAYALWGDDGGASGMSEAAFAESFAKYASYSAEIGAPGRIEGAAGSLYVEVPVRVFGTLTAGGPFNMEGPLTLRRVNDVPGSTEAQRQWHISASGIRPRPR